MTETGDPAWRQNIFWPFANFTNFGHGHVLRAKVASDTCDTDYFDPAGMDDEVRTPVTGVPYLKLAAVDDGKGGLTLFALNRDLTGEMRMEVDARGMSNLSIVQATTLHDADLDAVNTKANPDRIVPKTLEAVTIDGARITAILPPASWSVACLDRRGVRRKCCR